MAGRFHLHDEGVGAWCGLSSNVLEREHESGDEAEGADDCVDDGGGAVAEALGVCAVGHAVVEPAADGDEDEELRWRGGGWGGGKSVEGMEEGRGRVRS